MVSHYARGKVVNLFLAVVSDLLSLQSVWQFYGIDVPDVSVTRTSLLLRTLVVDPQPFQGLISELLSKTTDWAIR